ncbi:MAG: ribonuclease HII [Rhodobiaceae bacterium]|nr:ribonuclease HII [Rhodobiaceae bacterium]MCC0054818.1 ribonuclease HII [Rhodobiaceae bacterium]
MGGFSEMHRGTEEQALLARGVRRIAGVDEAGRGPLAGPVVAAAVVFGDRAPAGINDSKKLTARRREKLHDEILFGADVGIAIVSPATIDRLNILRASLEAMRMAVAALAAPPEHILVDGRDCPECPHDMTALIGGDARSLSIAAASIIAKVTRDRIMEALCPRYPDYGFSRHKGYPTAAHRQTLATRGVLDHHRRSFGPVRACLGEAAAKDTEYLR